VQVVHRLDHLRFNNSSSIMEVFNGQFRLVHHRRRRHHHRLLLLLLDFSLNPSTRTSPWAAVALVAVAFTSVAMK
jgi:hypothetical protein